MLPLNIPNDPNRQPTHEWMMEVQEAARAEAKKGDLRLINSLGLHASFAYFINNVGSGIISPEQFSKQFPAYIQEAEELRIQYERLESVGTLEKRMTTIEESLAQLPALMQGVTKLMESAGIKLTEDTEDTGGDGSDADAGGVPPQTPPIVPTPSPAPTPPAPPAPPAKPAKKPAKPAAPVTPPVPPVADETEDEDAE